MFSPTKDIERSTSPQLSTLGPSLHQSPPTSIHVNPLLEVGSSHICAGNNSRNIEKRNQQEVVKAVSIMSTQSKIRTVAQEKILSKDSKKIVGGMELGTNFGEVLIDIRIVGNEPLVRAFRRFKTIREVVGRSIARPLTHVALIGV